MAHLDATAPRNRQPYSEGWRTPVIEDGHHPLNLWRTQQGTGQINEAHFPPQDEITREHFARFQSAKTNMSRHDVTGQFLSKDGMYLPWRERVKHTSWAWFTICMATGGLANTLHTVPFRASWLDVVGLMFFFLNIVLYITIWAMLLTRFISYPSTFRASLVHPTESLFVPAFLVSFGTICITIVEYGAENAGVWLTKTVFILFWINVFLAVSLSVAIYMILWSSLTFTIAQMTPIWIFPAYPLLIVGPHAANLSDKLTSTRDTIEVIVGGFTVQGIGFLVSLTIYSAFVYRLMTQKLPADPSRPGMFVSVGPAAFTCSGTIGMAENLHRAIAEGNNLENRLYMGAPPEFAAQVLRLVANWMCLWLWGLAIWFFLVSVISNIAPLFVLKMQEHNAEEKEKSEERESNGLTGAHRYRNRHHHPHHRVVYPHKIPFAMTWYSYIFPQTALTTATFRIANAFEIYALKVVGCVMTALLVAMWFFVMTMMIRAVVNKQILWPEKGEDREEGGFVRPVSRRKSLERDRVKRVGKDGRRRWPNRVGHHAGDGNANVGVAEPRQDGNGGRRRPSGSVDDEEKG